MSCIVCFIYVHQWIIYIYICNCVFGESHDACNGNAQPQWPMVGCRPGRWHSVKWVALCGKAVKVLYYYALPHQSMVVHSDHHKRLMRHVLLGDGWCMDSYRIQQVCPRTSLMRFDGCIWHGPLSEMTIMKCFTKCGHGLETGDDSEEFLVQQLLGVVSWADIVDGQCHQHHWRGQYRLQYWESVLIAKARDMPDWASTSIDEQEYSQIC